jgi:hypothetical protein
MSIPSRPRMRGASRSSRTLRAGCGGRGSVRRVSAKTNDVVAYGEDAWSWRPDAGAKLAEAIPPVTGARKPGPRGERDISRKTIAWGMPDVSGASAVNTRVHTKTTKRTRGCGCIGHPAFPAPSYYFRGQDHASPGPIVPRECEAVSDALERAPISSPRHRPRMRTIQYSRDVNDGPKGRGVLDPPHARGDDECMCATLSANAIFGNATSTIEPAATPPLRATPQRRATACRGDQGGRSRNGRFSPRPLRPA